MFSPILSLACVIACARQYATIFAVVLSQFARIV